MSEQSLPPPRYTLWESMGVCLAMATRALEEVRALARIPGPDGKDGLNGKDGKDGVDGKDGEPGRQGEMGKAGTPGRDGLGFDTVEKIDEDGEYGFRFVQDGSVLKEFRFQKPSANLADCYKGVWKGDSHRRGDVVTLGGSAFLAMRDTSDKPETSDAWKLWVKRGRDGKDYRPEAERKQGPVHFK